MAFGIPFSLHFCPSFFATVLGKVGADFDIACVTKLVLLRRCNGWLGRVCGRDYGMVETRVMAMFSMLEHRVSDL
jgi:hypothetical protein